MQLKKFAWLFFSLFVLLHVNMVGALGQRVSLVSINRNRTASGNFQSLKHKISANGRYVVFESEASDLVPLDNNGVMDVFRYDLVTGRTRLVSDTPSGASGNGPSYLGDIDANGSHVVFTSEATNLLSGPPGGPSDTNGRYDVFIKSFPPPVTVCVPLCTALVSVNVNDSDSGLGDSHSPSISADGSKIAFLSFASDLIAGNPPGGERYYLREYGTAGTRTSLISPPVRSGGVFCSAPFPVDRTPVISPNGLFVAFATFLNDLTPEDDPCDANNAHDSDIFVYDLIANRVRLASIARTNTASGTGSSTNPVLANNGTVAFLSVASNLVNGDNNNQGDVFVQRGLGNARLVSVNMTGTESGNGDSSGRPSISMDGSMVAFSSEADNLIPNDTNLAGDVFVRDLTLNATSLVSANTSDATAGGGSFDAAISANGRFVAFTSQARPLDRAFPFPGTNFQVYVRDLRARYTTLVSVNRDNNGGGNLTSVDPQISADGSSISFASQASNLVTATDNEDFDIFALRRSRRATDYDNDGRTDVAVFRPSNGVWYISRSSDDSTSAQQFGLSGDVPVQADYDGDGLTDLAVFRPSDGIWYILQSTDNSFRAIQFGIGSDKPAAADFDGDGRTDIAVFRPSDGVWYIFNSSDNSFRFVQWGLMEDKPTPGDYDGDGRADIAVFRPSNGIWYIINSNDNSYRFQQFGLGEDKPVPGDYDGDGRTDIAVWRPSNGIWYVWRSSNNSLLAIQWGLNTDVPQPGDFDGDNRNDFVIWRPSQSAWYVLRSSNYSYTISIFGLSDDIAVSSPYRIE